MKKCCIKKKRGRKKEKRRRRKKKERRRRKKEKRRNYKNNLDINISKDYKTEINSSNNKVSIINKNNEKDQEKEKEKEKNIDNYYNNKKGSNSTADNSDNATKIIYHVKNPKQSFQIKKNKSTINLENRKKRRIYYNSESI